MVASARQRINRDELAKLIARQRRDATVFRLAPRGRELRSADLGIDLDRLPDRPSSWPGRLVGLSVVWTASLCDAVCRGRAPCPSCGGSPRRAEYCLVCDRSGVDGLMELPGVPVGLYLNAGWEEPEPAGRSKPLRGGVGA